MTDIDGEAADGAVPTAGGWGGYGRRPAVVLALVALIDSVDRGILPGVLTEVQDDLGFSDADGGAGRRLRRGRVPRGHPGRLPGRPAAPHPHHRRRARVVGRRVRGQRVRPHVLAVPARARRPRRGRDRRQPLVVLAAGRLLPTGGAGPGLRPPAGGADRRRVGGLGLGGLVGTHLGWRWAFLLVGVPGSLLALAVWRTPEPERGESDRAGADGELPLPGAVGTVAEVAAAQVEAAEAGPAPEARRVGFDALREDLQAVFRIRTLRSLMIGTAIGSGALQGMAFWATAFYERHTSLGNSGSAGVVAALIALGALVGTYVAGRLVDARRERMVGFPMLLSGLGLLIGSGLLPAD